jgi:hypothetical protein
MQLDTGEAKVDNAEYVMHKSRIRGNALYAKRAENAIIRLKDGTYTTCEPNSNAWQLKGNNITLNPATGFGTATNVTLRVKDIPDPLHAVHLLPDRRPSPVRLPAADRSAPAAIPASCWSRRTTSTWRRTTTPRCTRATWPSAAC